MFVMSQTEACLDTLEAELAHAQGVTPELLRRVIAGACGRNAAWSSATKSARINRLMAAEAWIEAALALIELELPQWRLRRLIFENDSWLCSLSRQWGLPDWLDDMVEARHESMPLAILGALAAVSQRRGTVERGPASSVPRCPIVSTHETGVCCCDNFA